MNVYFACSITGGREFEAVYQAIVSALIADRHEVPTAHLAKSDVLAEELIIAPREVYERDVAWIQNCDALIAEVSVPSHGVGYEIGYALNAGKFVLCLYRENRKVSKMISGNPHQLLSVKSYSDTHEAIALIRDFLDNITQYL
jgi:nucleoside 2-deoxyribosyltransferase